MNKFVTVSLLSISLNENLSFCPVELWFDKNLIRFCLAGVVADYFENETPWAAIRGHDPMNVVLTPQNFTDNNIVKRNLDTSMEIFWSSNSGKLDVPFWNVQKSLVISSLRV